MKLFNLFLVMMSIVCITVLSPGSATDSTAQRTSSGIISYTQHPPDPVFECNKDVSCRKLAEVIIYEARGEPVEGQIAVAEVVVNRTKDSRWPNKIVEVVNQPYQFSYLQDKHKQKPPTEGDRINAKAVAHFVLRGGSTSAAKGATHYHTKHVSPKWNRKLTKVASIGQHVFYK